MTTLTLNLERKNVDTQATVVGVDYLIYRNRKGNELVLVNTEGKLDLLNLPNGKNTIGFPDGWKAYSIPIDSLVEVTDHRGAVDWNHRSLNPLESWGKGSNWNMNVLFDRDTVKLDLSDIGEWIAFSYNLHVVRSNVKPQKESRCLRNVISGWGN